jgi:DNA repair protein SbcD/Mre11
MVIFHPLRKKPWMGEDMKILHTSDLHIGRFFENESLEEDQRKFIAWLCDTVREQEIDLVVIAGDIWDKAMPRQEAFRQLDDALNDLAATRAAIALIAGNHDNPVRLGWGASRQALGGVHIFSNDEHYPIPWSFNVRDEVLNVLPIPFLDPQRFLDPVVDEEGVSLPRTHHSALASALRVGRQRLAELGSAPTMAIAHAYVAGSTISDSERHTVGGSDVVGAELFAGFDYVALGHIHRPQEIDNNPAIAYSGSPLPYSYSEEAPKSVRIIDISPTGFVGARTVRIPVGRPVKVLTDTMQNLLTSPEYEKYVDHWISVKLTDEGIKEQPMERLRNRYPHITSVAYAARRQSGISGPAQGSVDVTQRAPIEIAHEYFIDMQGRPATSVETDIVESAMAEVEREAQVG